MPTTRPMTEEEIKALAKHLVGELLQRMTEEEQVLKVAKAWGGELDKWIGKNVRRFLLWVMLAISLFATIKFKLWEFLR